MPDINFQITYSLYEEYECIKINAQSRLRKYLEYPSIFTFDDVTNSITFTTERLLPDVFKGRSRVMLLFSNPHPHSVRQKMFLSPSTKGQENLFWRTMNAAGWLSIPKEKRTPEQLADICLKCNYDGRFDLIFYCYYAFPTNYPGEIRNIFENDYFNQIIEPKAIEEFQQTLLDQEVEAVVTFNKDIYNHVSTDKTDRYIKDLESGKLVCSLIKNINRDIPVFLTFPTGWRYHTDFMKLRTTSLELIKAAIIDKTWFKDL